MQSVRDGAEAEPGRLLCVLFVWGYTVSTQATGEVDPLAVDVAVIKSTARGPERCQIQWE